MLGSPGPGPRPDSVTNVPFNYSQDEFTMGTSEPLVLGPSLVQAPCKALGDAKTVSHDCFVLQMAPELHKLRTRETWARLTVSSMTTVLTQPCTV